MLNLHHRADTITRIVGDGSPFGVDVRYSWETEILGSAGGPARAIPLLASDRFLIVNGDTLADVDLRELVKQHIDTNALVTMAVVDGRPGYNGVVADARRASSRGFGARTQALGAFHFIGIQVVNASIFAGVNPDVNPRPFTASIRRWSRAGPARSGFFTPAPSSSTSDRRATTSTRPSTIARREGKPLDRGRDCSIAADATLADTILWDRVTVGAGARLSECVVADDVVVPAGANSRASRS